MEPLLAVLAAVVDDPVAGRAEKPCGGLFDRIGGIGPHEPQEHLLQNVLGLLSRSDLAGDEGSELTPVTVERFTRISVRRCHRRFPPVCTGSASGGG